MSVKKKYCSKCNKYGHYNKTCHEPIISVGIICINCCYNINTHNLNVNDIENFNYRRLSNINKIKYYKDKIKFLLIQRKHSLNYIHFVRGLYNEYEFNELKHIFSYMSKNEIEFIKNNNFETIWNNLWKKTAKKKNYHKEYKQSYNKFKFIIENNYLTKLYNIGSIYDYPEWEIPKGRKNNNESNINCAIREFYEETNISQNEYEIKNNITNIHDDFVGTDGNKYKNIFYIGFYKKKMNNIIFTNNNEINETRWCSWDEAITLIRPYHKNKINIINELFLLMINLNEEHINYTHYLNN
jgi:8-oxo-dGTP pyrophosphatase MutT (NUDIX family)